MKQKKLFSKLIKRSLFFYCILLLFSSMAASCLFELVKDNGDEAFDSEALLLTHKEVDYYNESEDEGRSRSSFIDLCHSGNEELCPDLEGSTPPEIDKAVGDYIPGYMFHFLGYYPDAPGWPDRPRRNLVVSEAKSNEITASIGGDLSFMEIIKIGLKKAIDTNASTGIELVLIKNALNPEDLIQKEENGKTYLKVDDRDFIGQCNYNVSASTSHRWVGNLKISGLGAEVEDTNSISSIITASHNTNFFKIREGDTTADLYLRCKQLFVKSIKQSLARELELAVKSTITIMNSNIDGFKEIVDRSLYGPETDDNVYLEIGGYNFTTKPITWYRPAGANGLDNSGILKIEGQLRHEGFFFPHFVNYSATIVNGNITEKNLGVKNTGGWKDMAVQIIEAIIHDAAIDFSAEFSEFDPGQKEYVTFYKDSHFKGDSIKLGVGQYANKYFPNIGWNDKISSIDVPPGFVVELYKGNGLREYSDWPNPFDKKWTITQSLSYNKEINDQISWGW